MPSWVIHCLFNRIYETYLLHEIRAMLNAHFSKPNFMLDVNVEFSCAYRKKNQMQCAMLFPSPKSCKQFISRNGNHSIVRASLGDLQLRNIHTGQRELPREVSDLLLEHLDLCKALLALLLGSGDADEILEELGACLLLEDLGELDGTVDEGCDSLHIFFFHVAGGEGGGAETDTAWGDCGGVATDGVFWVRIKSNESSRNSAHLNEYVLLMVTCIKSVSFSILLPVIPIGRRSHRRRWLSDPPLCILYP